MKNTFLGSIAGIAVCLTSTGRADVSIQWLQDSHSAFDVVFTGTGLPWEGAFTSPSGLWQLDAITWGGYLPGYLPDQPIEIGHWGQVTYLGEFPPELNPDPSASDYVIMTGMYNDFFPASLPIQDGNAWYSYCFLMNSLGWHGSPGLGSGPFTITSLPVVENPATWTWTVEYLAAGPSLAVPEPGIVSLGLAALVAFALGSRRTRVEGSVLTIDTSGLRGRLLSDPRPAPDCVFAACALAANYDLSNRRIPSVHAGIEATTLRHQASCSNSEPTVIPGHRNLEFDPAKRIKPAR